MPQDNQPEEDVEKKATQPKELISFKKAGKP
jgi:hypothetical protein